MTRIRLWIIITTLMLLIGNSVNATVNSVFAEDTCAPPCWFGLIAGESTSADVESLIAEYIVEDVEVYGAFDNETHQLITGVYEFALLKRETSRLFARIQIRDSLVHIIGLRQEHIEDITLPGEYVTLYQALNALGQPDFIYFDEDHSHFGNHSFPHVTFIYLAARLRIEFYASPYILASCYLQFIGEDMFLEKMTYYSPEAANELSYHVGHDEPQPALTALTVGDEVVTADMWQQVINGEIEEPCRLMPTVYDNPATAPIVYHEPVQPRSLLDEDSCAPPCWMGLIVGDSTSEDVQHLIQNTDTIFQEWIAHEDSVFDEQMGLIVSGSYRSNWLFHDFGDFTTFNSIATISVEAGVIDSMWIRPNRTILLHEVLRRLGTPDDVTMSWHDVSGTSLNFNYYDLRLYIYLRSIEQCYMDRMSNNFYVNYVEYYSPSSHQIPYDFSRDVPIEVWQQWVNGEETRSCSTAWHDLPESP
jgi:hypothetical protein